MNLSAKMILVLTSIGIISGLLLAGVDWATKERISANLQKELEEAVIQVVPGTVSSQKIYEEKGFTIYSGKDANGKILGYAINSEVGGFQDKIIFLLGTNEEFCKINRLHILDQKETPGLGAKITNETAFLQFWENRDCRQQIMLRKPPVDKETLGPSEVNTITGATVSSESVLSGVNATFQKIKTLRSEGALRTGE